MPLRREFRYESTALARQIRAELGLKLFHHLGPYQTCQKLSIPIARLGDIAGRRTLTHRRLRRIQRPYRLRRSSPIDRNTVSPPDPRYEPSKRSEHHHKSI